MNSTLAVIFIVAAMIASAYLGALVASVLCQKRRRNDAWFQAKRQQDLLDEITKHEEQEEVLRSELTRISKLCPEIQEQDNPVR